MQISRQRSIKTKTSSCRLCFYYGVSKVKRVFKRCELGQMTRDIVTRMLGNISKSLSTIQAGNGDDRRRLP